MRVLFVITKAEGGGAQRHLLDVMTALALQMPKTSAAQG